MAAICAQQVSAQHLCAGDGACARGAHSVWLGVPPAELTNPVASAWEVSPCAGLPASAAVMRAGKP